MGFFSSLSKSREVRRKMRYEKNFREFVEVGVWDRSRGR